ncbi:MAG TPA: transketolase C-terminal domain-containing protein [Gemmataceae bacterium]|jgi:transketolase|nr:transketolase C-terminal domain-containing protein [Gemmataceae bacterium]
MRTAFIQALCELAEQDSRVWLLTADLGWSVVESFQRRFPERFVNVGVAEQNLHGIATGLAREGQAPFVYSIATFAAMRGYEQFRNGPVLHQWPVRVVGIGGGFAYGHAGASHHSLEDLALARTQPGVAVIAPADSAQARSALFATRNLAGPAYFRIDKAELPDLPDLAGRFAWHTPELLRPGHDLLFLTTGSITYEVLKMHQVLEERGIRPAVAVLAHVGFQAEEALIQLLKEYPLVVTVEEGSAAGGLGSLVAETIAQQSLRCRLHITAVREPFLPVTGSVDYLRRQHGLDADSLAALARTILAAKRVRARRKVA